MNTRFEAKRLAGRVRRLLRLNRWLFAWLVLLGAPWGAAAAPQVDVVLPSAAREFPCDIALNSQGEMFLVYSDSSLRRGASNLHQTVRIAATGLDLRSQGSGYILRGMTLDRQGNLYLTDGSTIFRFDPRGTSTRLVTGFQDVIDLKADPAGNLYVAEAMQCAVYKLTPQLVKSRLVARAHRFQMREMLAGIAFDPKFENLYLAERYTGQILRYRLQADGLAGPAEVMASDIVSLRSLAVDERGNIFASIDFPIILRIDPEKRQSQFIIPNNQDFCLGRIALGTAPGDRDTLYLPSKPGLVRIRNAGSL